VQLSAWVSQLEGVGACLGLSLLEIEKTRRIAPPMSREIAHSFFWAREKKTKWKRFLGTVLLATHRLARCQRTWGITSVPISSNDRLMSSCGTPSTRNSTSSMPLSSSSLRRCTNCSGVPIITDGVWVNR